ncbi:MAG: orotidine 5'-phosphate decarboxylase [Candidatus Blackburnbacteria bacterium]|nr:orotidine 5'-phosphate decarboxylase [Candidatus Blackburnbacteria bacterium]
MATPEFLISRRKSVVVAADIEAGKLSELVRATCLVEGIGGYKVGLRLALGEGLSRIVGTVREYTPLPIIYDHQKAGNDIPAMGTEFAEVCRKAGVDAVILFPFSSPVTEEKWIKAAQDAGLTVLVGGHMTHEQFLDSEGGFIAQSAPDRIYEIAANNGVRDFVVPGNKVEYVERYRGLLERVLGKGNFTLYAPGFITQKGEISDFAKAAGDRWHAIVGSAIYKAIDLRAAAEQMTQQIR